MAIEPTRRGYLAALGSATVGLTADVSGAIQTDCPTVEDRQTELEERQQDLEALEAERAALADRIAALREELPAARAAWREQNHEFPADQREAARTVGLSVRESVVVIELAFGAGGTGGTGWFYDDGLIVTNSHVVEGFERADTTRAWTVDGEELSIELVDRVETLSPDVGLLRTDHDGPVLPLGDSSTLEAGDPLVAVGHPGSYGNWVISLGAYDRRDRHDESEIITDVPSLQGNSGSPTLTMDGEVVAMLKGAGGIPSTEAAPEPASLDVHTEPIAPEEDVLHDSVEIVRETVEGWR